MKLRKNKINEKFIKDNKDLIITSSLENAKRLHNDAETLIKGESYSSALGLTIAGLEEIAKASLIKKNDLSNLDDLVNHRKKAIEIMNLSGECYKIPTISQDRLDWARERIPQMREDSTYVRLKPTQGNKIKPDDNYWRKRTLNLFKFLSDILKKIKI